MHNLFRKLLLIALVVLSFALYGASAHALNINYADLANGIGCLDSNGCGEGGFDPLIVVKDGITVTATSPSGNGNDYPYLDSNWWWGNNQGGPAGLGVCQSLEGGTSGECDPGDDDNLTFNGHQEVLVLTFSEEVTITEILIRNGVHETDFDGDFLFNSIGYSLAHIFDASVAGSDTVFSFSIESAGLNNDNQMYIEAITFASVPEPSTLLLLGFGLIALGLFGRKRINSRKL